MKHFNEKEWQMFRRGEYPKGRSRFMEEHLQGCQICLDAFLNSINEEEVAQAQKAIPPDFTDTVISMINREEARGPSPCFRWVKQSQNLLAYYAAAAVLTIALMGGGAFQALVKGYSNVAGTTELNSQKIEQKVDIQFSKKIVDQTHQLIIRFENQE